MRESWYRKSLLFLEKSALSGERSTSLAWVRKESLLSP